jgi:hypothetical protein
MLPSLCNLQYDMKLYSILAQAQRLIRASKNTTDQNALSRLPKKAICSLLFVHT